jgi:molybdopterin-containing oxidoreductase family iron-sulfur binding subunit
MSQKKYWKGLEELNATAEHQKAVGNEFKEDLPFDISGGLLEANTPRRDFLKFLGFSTAAAMLAASCEMPVRRAIPYAIKPEDIVPGVPNYYASTFVDGGDYCAVIVKTRDGRPIKLDGNEKSAITGGSSSARVQAAVLNLYDRARLRFPVANGDAKNELTFADVDRRVKEGLAANNKQIYILTSTILSPTTKEVIAKFIAKYPGAKHVTYDAISHSGMLLANQESYGKRALPSYHFDKAKTIFSLDADFLGTWLSPVEFSSQYGVNRMVSVGNMNMSRHYHVEPTHTVSGATADYRATCRPSEIGAVATALYNLIANGTQPSFANKNLNGLLVKAAEDLKKGSGLVVCGANDKNIQLIVNAINDKIGAVGNTINWAVTSNYKQGIDAEMVTLVEDMNADKVGALFMWDVNPAYDYFENDKFVAGLNKVALSVSFADRLDETAQKAKIVAPDHNWLESWGDAEPKTGYFSFMQPTIAPLFKTRAFQDCLMAWAGETGTYHDFWNQYWLTKLGGQSNFDKALQDGIVQPAAMTFSGAAFAGNVGAAMAAVQQKASASKMELVVYPSVAIGQGGVWSNNPWLQEMPDPITKATWDNYVCMSPKTAREQFDAELTSINEVEANKKQVTIKWKSKTVTLPIVVVPGMHNDVVAVAFGYGRDKGVGRAAASGIDKDGKEMGGKNVFPFVSYNTTSQNFMYANAEVTVEKAGTTYPVAITQTHHSYEGRAIIHEFTLEEFTKDPTALLKERYAELGHYANKPWEHHETPAEGYDPEFEEKFRTNGTLYPNYNKEENKYEAVHWGMSIDLNACTGCGACVIACQAENNISVVGKTHVLKAQEMHWIRIDRYFSGNADDPDSIQTVFQPMMCQHCDNAPCENVCPVNATSHSSEGLNQMTYNRCIGTKYCANNCPYKVRHFNWMDWNGADCFDDNLYEDGRRDDMNDELTRMVLNPDVTVRSRGVMEKCSFCVQRQQEGKLAAKKEHRPLEDKDVYTACSRACAAGCIVFGNANDPNSKISQVRKQNKERVFYVLEQLHVLPNINYLSRIRNSDKVVAGDKKEDLMMNQSKLIS